MSKRKTRTNRQLVEAGWLIWRTDSAGNPLEFTRAKLTVKQRGIGPRPWQLLRAGKLISSSFATACAACAAGDKHIEDERAAKAAKQQLACIKCGSTDMPSSDHYCGRCVDAIQGANDARFGLGSDAQCIVCDDTGIVFDEVTGASEQCEACKTRHS